MRGVSLQFIRDLLGHADMRMTIRYAHLAPSVLAPAVALLDAPVPPEKSGHSAGNAPAPSEWRPSEIRLNGAAGRRCPSLNAWSCQ